MTRRDGARRRPRDDGAAIVESLLVLVVLVFFVLGILQLGFALHVRNTLVACASEGARYGANADRSPADGAARAQQLVASVFGSDYSAQITSGTVVEDGVTTVVVEIQATLPMLGPLGPSRAMTVRGHALEEAP